MPKTLPRLTIPWSSFLRLWISTTESPSATLKNVSTSSWIKLKTTIGEEWEGWWPATATSLLQSKKVSPFSIKICGIPDSPIKPKKGINTIKRSNYSPASNISTVPSFLPIFGFSKAFADTSILSSLCCWT